MSKAMKFSGQLYGYFLEARNILIANFKKNMCFLEKNRTLWFSDLDRFLSVDVWSVFFIQLKYGEAEVH